MILGVLIALVLGGPKSDSDPIDRMHPVFLIGMICMAAGWVFGVMGMFMHEAPMRDKLVFTREFFGMPAAMFIGYRMTKSFKSAQKFPYALILGGLGVSLMLMAAFGRGAERYEVAKDYNALRSINFITSYAGVACGLMIYSVLAGLRILRAPVGAGGGGVLFHRTACTSAPQRLGCTGGRDPARSRCACQLDNASVNRSDSCWSASR